MSSVWYRSVWVDKDGWEITLTFEVVACAKHWERALKMVGQFEKDNAWLGAYKHAYLHAIKEEEA